jgi:hypothetical protein
MIRVYIHNHVTNAEFITAADAYAALRQAPEAAALAVLRITSDAEWLDFAIILAEKVARAMHGSALINAPAFIWAQSQVFPEGDGWRLVLEKRALQGQMQPAQGMPNGGLSGLRR